MLPADDANVEEPVASDANAAFVGLLKGGETGGVASVSTRTDAVVEDFVAHAWFRLHTVPMCG